MADKILKSITFPNLPDKYIIPETQVDSVPTQGSTNAVQSGGVKSALDTLQAQIPQIDPTLSQSGQAADAKVVGDEIEGVKSDVSGLYPAKAALVSALNKNRFDGKSEPGYLDANGKLNQSSNWRTTNFIYVGDLTTVIASATYISDGNRANIAFNFCCTYDEDGNLLGTATIVQGIDYYTVETGVKYIRFAYHSDIFVDTSIQVESGTQRSDYEPYCYDILCDALEKVGHGITARNNDAFATNVLEDITSAFTIANGYIDKNTGIFCEFANAETTGYINIYQYGDLYVSGSPLYSSNCLYAVYDFGKRFLGYYKNNTVETNYHFLSDDIFALYPSACYARFSSITASGGINITISKNKNLIDIVGEIEGSWTGKKWVCVGDSLTEVNSRTTKHYFDFVSEKTGISVVNMGLSGSGYKHTTASGTGAFYQRISNVPTDADVVTIFGSGNDLTHGYPLGTVTDTGMETICGCINTTLDTLIGLIPTVQLGIVAPTPWVNFPPSTANNAMAQYVDALRTICNNRSIPFLDLYHCSNLRPWTAEGRAACYSKDDGNGVHPDETGHKIIAPRFKGFLETLLV